MATIKICDRCHEQINPPVSAVHVSIGGRGDLEQKELCVSCGMWLRKYLDGEAMVLRQEENER